MMTGQKYCQIVKKPENSRFNAKALKKYETFCENQGGVKSTAGSETSRVSGNYHERKEPVVVVMGSKPQSTSKSAMFSASLFHGSWLYRIP